jgi:predicted ferric reductase
MFSNTQSPRTRRSQANSREVSPVAANGKSHTVANAAGIIAGLGLGAALALELQGMTFESAMNTGSLFIFLGRICAMVGTYGVIITLFLIARIPWFEREVGFDKTVYWHRKIAPYALFLIGFHVIFTVVGYSITDKTSALHELWSLVTTTRWILPATAGLILMIMAGVTSYKVARRRITYETWWVIHLYTYLAVALSYAHQVSLGNAFIRNHLASTIWLVLTVSAAGSLVLFRWVLPILRGLRYQLRVHAVVVEGPGVVSVWLTGHNLRKMKASAGQFFCWRFMTPELWWHAHPYSLSAPPDGKYLRITVKDLGDHSRALADLKPGTKVIAEGPYGAFTASRRNGERVVLIAGGVGITPIRAVLEELPVNTQVDVLYRARSHDEVVLRRELDQLADRPHTNIRYLVGNRKEFPMDARSLRRLVPQIASSDVYICGPESMTNTVRHAITVLGVPESHIHDEAFAF